MNVAFFLLPKQDVICLTPDSTVRQALERMEYHRYSAVPLLDEAGKYVGTLTEGDLLWALKNTPDLSFDTIRRLRLKDIPRKVQNRTVHIDAQIESLIPLVVAQNFVPVVDDEDRFIGIVRRREIMEYCAELMMAKERSEWKAGNAVS